MEKTKENIDFNMLKHYGLTLSDQKIQNFSSELTKELLNIYSLNNYTIDKTDDELNKTLLTIEYTINPLCTISKINYGTIMNCSVCVTYLNVFYRLELQFFNFDFQYSYLLTDFKTILNSDQNLDFLKFTEKSVINIIKSQNYFDLLIFQIP